MVSQVTALAGLESRAAVFYYKGTVFGFEGNSDKNVQLFFSFLNLLCYFLQAFMEQFHFPVLSPHIHSFRWMILKVRAIWPII